MVTKEKFQNIEPGQLIWEEVPRFGDFDYHPAVVSDINVDEAYVDVVDVSQKGVERRVQNFYTEQEVLEKGIMTQEAINKEYDSYRSTIERILERNL